MAVSRIADVPPHKILDDGLKTQEVRYGITSLPSGDDLLEHEKEMVSSFHARVARETASKMGEAGRQNRARRAAFGKHAAMAKMTLDDYLADRAKQLGISVDQLLAGPKKQSNGDV